MVKMLVKMMVKMMMMKKVSDDDGYLVMKVILWWNLSKDESYLVMKVIIVKEVMTGDVSPLAMFECGAISFCDGIWILLVRVVLCCPTTKLKYSIHTYKEVHKVISLKWGPRDPKASSILNFWFSSNLWPKNLLVKAVVLHDGRRCRWESWTCWVGLGEAFMTPALWFDCYWDDDHSDVANDGDKGNNGDDEDDVDNDADKGDNGDDEGDVDNDADKGDSGDDEGDVDHDADKGDNGDDEGDVDHVLASTDAPSSSLAIPSLSLTRTSLLLPSCSTDHDGYWVIIKLR